jgi:HK97 family phage prohead protease
MKLKQRSVTIKAGEQDGLKEGEFLVYPSTFIREPDAYGDVVAKGAFLKSLAKWKESGMTMPGLFGHRMDDPDYFVAEGKEYDEDDHGWWVKGAFDFDIPKAPSTYKLVKGKRITQMSFAYDTISEAQIELDDGRKANELRELDVIEFSFVPLGANQDTSIVAVKGATEHFKTIIDLRSKGALDLKDDHIASLREAHKTLGDVLEVLAEKQEDENEAEASQDSPANSEERESANEEEQAKSRTVRAAALVTITEALV